MEEMMMMMIRSPENPRNESIADKPITTSTCPTWKLYENPFYISQQQQQKQVVQQQQENHSQKQIHRLHLPISARKIAASFWDLTFIRPFMVSELEMARAQIIELKAELEYERKSRKKMESMNKRLMKDVSEEKRGREALERVCEDLAKEISSNKTEINRMKKEMEEERKMLRMAEVLREERVQMKLAEAKLLLEEKLLELEATKRMQFESSSSKMEDKNQEGNLQRIITADNSSGEPITITRFTVLSEKPAFDSDNNGIAHSVAIQRRASTEPENPHIRRGIKGFVEFPKVVRAIGSKSRHWGTKLECQKAQLRILLKQKCPVRSNNLIMS
ncbi:unnamed protein product [Ilex paraguariensis]|uniref:Branchless trichome n=1 Tax=Ilex paraguariensis TaxID=185542 RepID=A0ABC8TMA7_9AQUA